jgi:hypothetical protein
VEKRPKTPKNPRHTQTTKNGIFEKSKTLARLNSSKSGAKLYDKIISASLFHFCLSSEHNAEVAANNTNASTFLNMKVTNNNNSPHLLQLNYSAHSHNLILCGTHRLAHTKHTQQSR